ncbi:MAG: SDR family oxidoreductase [Chloroflexi bacterium]|nr:SDR family oxidoreductase [Chloroflexota bacterium]
MRLSGNVAIVTGGGQGLGKYLSKRLAEEGATVVLAGRTQAALDATVQEITSAGGAAAAIPTDITKEEQVVALVSSTVERFGSIDILVNNAGQVGPMGDFMSAPAEAWLQNYQVNLMGAMFCSREAMKAMLPKRKGSIINISSIGGTHGFLPTMPYNVTKAALNVLTKDLARIGAPHLVRTNALTLGPVSLVEGRVESDHGETVVENMDIWPMFGLAKPASEWLDPEDIAKMVAFLASEDARSVNGQIVELLSSVKEE